MRKHTLRFVALMVAVLLTLSGCSMIAVDPVKDAAEPVIKVNDITLTKGDLQSEFNNNVAYTYMMYGYFGMNYSVDQIVDIVRDSFVNSEVQEQVQLLKAKELGLDQFTEEEETAFQEELAKSWAEYLASADSEIEGIDEMTDEQKLDAETKYLESFGETHEVYEGRQRSSKILEKVHDYAIKDVEVTDEEVQTAYQEKVDSDEATYSANTLSFEQAVTNGTDVGWIPEGYRSVLHILLKYDDDRNAEISSLNTELDDIATKISELEANAAADAEETADEVSDKVEETVEEVAETAEETAEETAAEAGEAVGEVAAEAGEIIEKVDEEAGDVAEEVAAEVEGTAEEVEEAVEEAAEEAEEAVEEPETIESLTARKDEINERIAQIQAEFLAEKQETIDEIRSRLEAGEDFRALINEYSGDTGMMEGTNGYKNGYYVSSASSIWEQSFTDGAMALEKVGDLSEPVYTTNGIHLIYYDSDVQSGPVDIEVLREGLHSDLLSDKQTETYNATLEEWKNACTIKTWPDRLAYTGN